MKCILKRLIAVFQVEKKENGIPERSMCKGQAAQQDMACWGSKDHKVDEVGVMVVQQSGG